MTRLRWLLSVLLIVAATPFAWSYYQRATAASTMTARASAFLETLNPEQRQVVVMEYASPQRVDWHFIPKDERKGLQLRHMNDAQREAAHALLKSALSQLGYDKSVKIMSLESLLNELEGGGGRFARDPVRYYFTVFGDPSPESRWGLSVEGHHLSLNFVVEGDRIVSSTPQVFCSNPATVKTENKVGIEVGTRVLKDEEVLAFELVNSLSADQLAKALIAEEAFREVRDPGSPQPPQEPPVGLAVSGMTDEQSALLRKLVKTYTSAMVEQVATDRFRDIDDAGWPGVHFAWAGAREPGIGHYYRIQGPTFVIEFVNTQPDAAGNPANHIHAVWRDMRGDFALAVQ